METFLSLNKVSMTFGERTKFHALDSVSLSVERGEFVSLIGHSGCGKSTLLNLIAGLYRPSAGLISCEGQQILGPGPDRGVVFQNHSLLPWMTCHDNILWELRRSSPPGSTRVKCVERSTKRWASSISVTRQTSTPTKSREV